MLSRKPWSESMRLQTGIEKKPRLRSTEWRRSSGWPHPVQRSRQADLWRGASPPACRGLLSRRCLSDHIYNDGVAGLIVEHEEQNVPAYFVRHEVQAVVAGIEIQTLAGYVEGIRLEELIVVGLPARGCKGDELHPCPGRNYGIL